MEKISSEDRDRVSMYLWAALRTASPGPAQPIYTYYFDRAIPWPQHSEYGAFHSGELPYFFHNLNRMNRPWQPVDFRVSRQVSAYLKNFAATGDPNGSGLPRWPAFQPGSAVTMQLGAQIEAIPIANPARLAFWKTYFASPESAHSPIF
jgi:para-nitrobenzyl esterase